MSLPESTTWSLPRAGDKSLSYRRPAEPPVLMVEDEPPIETALGAHCDPRALVRVIQCPHCSKPFSAPVHLTCGHTICRGCLPSARPRANVSYPNTPDRLQGITCPLCNAEHAAAECCVDVKLSKIMEVVQEVVLKHKSSEETWTRLVEKIVSDDSRLIKDNEKADDVGHERVLHGGRLLATFTMAQMGQLRNTSEVEYSPDDAHYEYENLDKALLDDLQEGARDEMNCQVCYNLMLDPTTTACGHTFCRRCLTRVMDHANICPLCRRNLHMPASLQNKPSNDHLASLLDMLCPDLIAERIATNNIEEQAGDAALNMPLFICALALPDMPTFLHVFEPRYRLMMRRCMDGNREFGMVMYNRTGASQGHLGVSQFMEYGTRLYIENLELLRDGRSFVETRGRGRFKVQDHGMLDGYIVGRVETVEDISVADEQVLEQQERTEAHQFATALRLQTPEGPDGVQGPLLSHLVLDQLPTQELLDLCMRFVQHMRAASAPWLSAKIVSVYGEPPNDPAKFPYWFACVLPIAEEEKYRLLQTTRVRERLKIVKMWIERIQNQRHQHGGSCGFL